MYSKLFGTVSVSESPAFQVLVPASRSATILAIDKPSLFAMAMSAGERIGANIVSNVVIVRRRPNGEPTAHIHLAVDSSNNVGAFEVAEAIVGSTGATVLFPNFSGADAAAPSIADGTFELGAWRSFGIQAGLEAAHRCGVCLSTQDEAERWSGPGSLRTALEAEVGNFPVWLRREVDHAALKNAASPALAASETRLAWVIAGLGGNVEYLATHSEQGPLGQKRRVAELIASVECDLDRMRALKSCIDCVIETLGLRRGWGWHESGSE